MSAINSMAYFWRRSLVVFSLLLFAYELQAQVTKYVDPFLGTEGDGNTFPGPSLPFGMIKPGPDAGSNNTNAGWEPRGEINGFSQTHVSGTGGGPKYGNILVQPTTGVPKSKGYGSERGNELAVLGLYQVTLKRYGIHAEITTARRTALYRFVYPASSHSNILFDAAHCLSGSISEGEGQRITASEVTVLSPTEVTGSTTVAGGWNQQTTPYTVYFYAVSDTPAKQWGTWKAGRLHPATKSERGAEAGTGAWLSFATRQQQPVLLKVAISFVSIEQARRNAESEITDFDFERVRKAAISSWERMLAKVELQGATSEQAQIFYTALYHTMLMPVDRTGENPLWQSDEPYYDDFYAIWDTFRTSSPLLTILDPQRESDIVRALVDIYRHEGWLPDARSGNFTGRAQGGSNAEFLIGDAYAKGLPGIDWAAAYQAMVKDAEVSAPEPMRYGRGGLEDWKRLGYLTIEGVDRPGSKQMEYAANDFEIALVAKGLGRDADYTKYLSRSGNWKNLWDTEVQEDGIRGFIRPRHKDGSWKRNFNAMQNCSWGGDTFYEGNSWTYSLFVPHDVGGLIQQAGGNQEFVKRLDSFFDGPERFDVSNEPGFLSSYLYIWAGRHDRTVRRIHQIMGKNFHAGRAGLPGNDDSGAMSSWYAFGAMGFFPNAGQNVYLIGSPTVPGVIIHLENGGMFVIEAKNFSPSHPYVIAAELNGHRLDHAWFRHEDIAQGGRLVLTMSPVPNSWPSGNAPPSSSDPQ